MAELGAKLTPLHIGYSEDERSGDGMDSGGELIERRGCKTPISIDFVTEGSKICEIRRVFSCGIFKGVGDGCARRFNIRIGGYLTLVLRWKIYTKTNRKCELR